MNHRDAFYRSIEYIPGLLEHPAAGKINPLGLPSGKCVNRRMKKESKKYQRGVIGFIQIVLFISLIYI
jgi:hypothetical protein